MLISVFFTFLPIGPEDLDEIDGIYDQYLAEEERAENKPSLSADLNASDREFLRRHGIRF